MPNKRLDKAVRVRWREFTGDYAVRVIFESFENLC